MKTLGIFAGAFLWGATGVLTSAQPAAPAVKGSESYRAAFDFTRKRQFDEAKQSIRQLDEKNPAHLAERLAIEAWMEFIRCRLDTAEAKARAALAANPNQPLALMLMSRLMEAKNSMTDAAAYAKTMAREDPNNAILLTRVVSALADPKDFPARLELFQRLAALVAAPEFEKGRKKILGNLEVEKKLAGRATDILAEDSGKRLEVPLVLDETQRYQLELTFPDGSKTRAVLDSGATTLILDGKTGNALKRETLAEGPIFTIAGEGRAETALLENFSLGGMKWRNVVCSTGQTYPQSLLGMSLFRNTVLVVDFKRSRLLAFADAQDFEKEWAADLPRATRMNFVTLGGFIMVPCTVTADGDSAARSAMVLDTGASRTYLGKRFAERWSREQAVRIEEGAARQMGGAAAGGQVINQFVSSVSVHYGKLQFTAPKLSIIDMDALQQDIGLDFSLLVGFDRLSQFEFVAFDFPRRVIYFGAPR
jgi:predicted aspartyl protease